MEDVRCDVFTDNYLSFEIEKGFLKINTYNDMAYDGENTNCVFLSKESVISLITDLLNELGNITEIEKSAFI